MGLVERLAEKHSKVRDKSWINFGDPGEVRWWINAIANEMEIDKWKFTDFWTVTQIADWLRAQAKEEL